MYLRTNTAFDKEYLKVNKELSRVPTPPNFMMITDLSNRFMNEYGLTLRFIEKLYLLGYIDGKRQNEN